MCCTRLAENTGRKKVVKNRHLGTIAQLYRAMSSQLRHVSTNVDAAYCYRPSIVVYRLVFHSSEPCKNGWLIDMLIRLWNRVGPRNYVLHPAADPPWEVALFQD